VETTEQKGARREKTHMPKPEEHEGMPQHQDCPPAKRREGRSPKYQEEQQKEVARILEVHPPKKLKGNIIEIEIVYNNTIISRLLSLSPPA
jgi:hypothetical protein